MDTARLMELVKIQKKADASKAVKKEFYDLWLQFIRENGPGEEAFQLLVDGFSFCGMEPFAEYLKSTAEIQKTVIAFLHSSAFGKNSAVAFKCALNLLACLIRDVETEFATCAVIMRELPGLAYNKKRQLLTDLGKGFVRYFYSVVYAKKRLPSLGNYGLSSKGRESFVLVLRHGLEQAKELQMDEREQMGAQLVIKWMEDNAEEQEPLKENGTEEKKDAESSGIVNVAATVAAGTAAGASAVTAASVIEAASEEPKSWPGLYEKGIQYLETAYKKALQELQGQNLHSQNSSEELEKLQNELQKKNEEIERLKAEIVDRDEQLTVKDLEIRAVQADVSWLKSELEKKEKEISDRIQMNEIVRMNSERTSDQQLRRLASELRTYYEDTMAAEGAEMTVEMGEILLDQIKEVFAVLMRNGIRVDQ